MTDIAQASTDIFGQLWITQYCGIGRRWNSCITGQINGYMDEYWGQKPLATTIAKVTIEWVGEEDE